jgi:hypothetical protein
MGLSHFIKNSLCKLVETAMFISETPVNICWLNIEIIFVRMKVYGEKK